MNNYKLPIHADVSWASLETAAGYFERDGDTPRLLFCHTREYSAALEAINNGSNVLAGVEVIADSAAPTEWWLLLGEKTMVWSCP